jgi:Fe-S cluster assembly protein SufD
VQIDAHPQAVVDSCTVTFGGLVVRNEVHPTLLGEGIQCGMFGLTVLGGKQHVDNYTVLDHAKPRCESNELFKGIYGGHASGVFRGTIIVREDAQKTNAFQSNQSVLVSNDATIFSEPQLKIWADDVKCTHGATVGQLDEQALFYIRSRGVSKEEAMGMLIKAFASAVFEKVTDAALNVRLEELLTRKLQLVLHSTAQ